MNAMSLLGRIWKHFAVWSRPRRPSPQQDDEHARAVDRLSDMLQRMGDGDDIDEADRAFAELGELLRQVHEAEADSLDIFGPSEAQCCESAGDWPGAEAAHRKALETALASGSLFDRSDAYANLCAFQTLMDCGDEAMESARAAVDVSRPVDFDAKRSMKLRHLAETALLFGHVSDAKAAIDEALSLLRAEKMWDGMRGQCLAVNAGCAQRAGDETAAERDLEAAWEYLEPWTRSQSPWECLYRSASGGQCKPSSKPVEEITNRPPMLGSNPSNGGERLMTNGTAATYTR